MHCMTPLQYYEKFQDVPVHYDNEVVRVHVDQYRHGLKTVGEKRGAAKSEFTYRVKKHFRKHGDIMVMIETIHGETTFVNYSSRKDLGEHSVDAFYGKGSPEDIQLTLQLAVEAGVIEKSESQAYVDEHMGLDCNGFVGNYIWHVFRGNRWEEGDAKDRGVGANTLIGSIVRKPYVDADHLSRHTHQIYVIGWVDRHGKVVNRTTQGAAHVAITEPLTMRTEKRSGDKLWPSSVKVIESTGGKGLVVSDYDFLDYKRGVFKVFRGSKEKESRVVLSQLI